VVRERLNPCPGAFFCGMTFTAFRGRNRLEQSHTRLRIAWLELTCLMCGEISGYIEDQRVVRPVYAGGIVLEHGQPRCGRCNALLIAGERGVATSRAGIG